MEIFHFSRAYVVDSPVHPTVLFLMSLTLREKLIFDQHLKEPHWLQKLKSMSLSLDIMWLLMTAALTVSKSSICSEYGTF